MGCETPTCGFINHAGDKFDCGVNRTLLNLDAITIDHYTCCQCDAPLVPMNDNSAPGVIADGCETPTCGFIDHDGTKFDCGVNRSLINLDAITIDHFTCCQCDFPQVPLDGNITNGCETPTCGFMLHDSTQFDCGVNRSLIT